MSDAVKSRTLKSSDNQQGALSESALRSNARHAPLRTEFVRYHESRTRELVQFKLEIVHEKWEVGELFSNYIGKKKPSFETWAVNKPVVRLKPDGTNIMDRSTTKVFGLVAESLTVTVEGSGDTKGVTYDVSFACKDDWLIIKTVSKR
jgi:hypothetical protein